MTSFDKVLDNQRQPERFRPKKALKRKKRVHIQEQKYSLVPRWRRRRK